MGWGGGKQEQKKRKGDGYVTEDCWIIRDMPSVHHQVGITVMMADENPVVSTCQSGAVQCSAVQCLPAGSCPRPRPAAELGPQRPRWPA